MGRVLVCVSGRSSIGLQKRGAGLGGNEPWEPTTRICSKHMIGDVNIVSDRDERYQQFQDVWVSNAKTDVLTAFAWSLLGRQDRPSECPSR